MELEGALCFLFIELAEWARLLLPGTSLWGIGPLEEVAALDILLRTEACLVERVP